VRSEPFRLRSGDGLELFVHHWAPDIEPARATVQIAHGMGEHSGRYERLATQLCAAGFAVYAPDTRGHGLSLFGPDQLGHLADDDGWNKAVDDVDRVAKRIAADRAGVRHALIGHSLGSLLAIDSLTRGRTAPDAVVLSGTSGPPGRAIWLALAVARFERLRLGVRGQSALLQRMLFGQFNRAFEPGETAFDWLSRDRLEVAKYVADPLCGFVLSVGGICDLSVALGRMFTPSALAGVPRDVPVLLLSGANDPVHDSLRGFRALASALRDAGVTRLTERIHPEGRHEMFNETNRDEVTRDLLDWLESSLFPRAAVVT
jgi:alpha-beta hydrolase superfamily lysophospholipase